MKALIPTERLRWQFRLQLALLPCFYLAPWMPRMALVAGALLMTAFGWLGFCLWGAWRQYLSTESQMQRLSRDQGTRESV